MEFKNPHFLYFLFFLIIPILVHLFQLQKFKKVPFTNVAFLQKISQQNRKSSKLKKWLILATRLLLFSSIILAFSQPYIPSKNSKKIDTKNYVYLDNSLSLNSKGKRGNILQKFSQDILENLDETSQISLLTNDGFYDRYGKDELKSLLQNTEYSPKTKSLADILLELRVHSNNQIKDLDEIFLISDFQNFNKKYFTDVNSKISLISDTPQTKNNISIDSLKIKKQTSTSVTLQVYITNYGKSKKDLPFSLYTNKILTNKQTVSVENNTTKSIEFTLEKSPYILGEIIIDFQDTFLFDNNFNFVLDFRSKINVLSIGKKSNYLSRIFTETEFNFSESKASNVDYNSIPNQQLIILNELDQISSTLQNSLKQFTDNEGTLVIIPSVNIKKSNYNLFLANYKAGKIRSTYKDTLLITKISFNHPLFSDVFSKKIKNFEYPAVYMRYQTNFNGNTVLSYANSNSFLEQLPVQKGKLYWFSAALNEKNSNFSKSPLIVPTFYNLAYQNNSTAKPYYFAGKSQEINVKASIKQDDVLKISKNKQPFIPLQQVKFNTVTLSLSKELSESGFYAITRGLDTIQHIAVNYNPIESNHNYLDINTLQKDNKNVTILDSIDQLFKEIKEKNEVQSFWKLFLILAIVSLLFEILILKFFKT